MKVEYEAIQIESFSLPPVSRPRLARYLELPSARYIDPITDAEIEKLDQLRHELLSLWQRAVRLRIEQVGNSWIKLGTCNQTIKSSDGYCRHLRDTAADSLIVTGLTLGRRVDRIIERHLLRDELYEAFILKQWCATMTEQARLEMTRRLRTWADEHDRTLLRYDGPGYDGWPLETLVPLLQLLCRELDDTTPLRVSEIGVLLPTNSMLIVHGTTPGRNSADNDPRLERLAQCHRCSMHNCNYRLAAAEATEPDWRL